MPESESDAASETLAGAFTQLPDALLAVPGAVLSMRIWVLPTVSALPRVSTDLYFSVVVPSAEIVIDAVATMVGVVPSSE